MLGFSHPWILSLLLLIPLMMILRRRKEKKQAQKLSEYINESALKRMFPEGERSNYRLKQIFFMIAFLSLILASAGLRVGSGLKELKQEGMDVIVALDLSSSMTAQDMTPSRLDRSRYEIKRLISMLTGDRIGLVGFAGVSYLQCPLTSDYRTAGMMLEMMDETLLPIQGTAFSEAIAISMNAFPDDVQAHKAIVIVSDGEDHEQEIDEAVQKARNAGIIIYTLGVGTMKGAPIPIMDKNGKISDYKRDEDGHVITTVLQENVLRNIARSTGGKYFQVGVDRNPIEAIYDDILHGDRKEYQTHEFARYQELYLIFAWIGFLFLLLAVLWPESRRETV